MFWKTCEHYFIHVFNYCGDVMMYMNAGSAWKCYKCGYWELRKEREPEFMLKFETYFYPGAYANRPATVEN